jgi:predicted RNA-binding Zn-ribbon protein involved in translation (DUF1610 family)
MPFQLLLFFYRGVVFPPVTAAYLFLVRCRRAPLGEYLTTLCPECGSTGVQSLGKRNFPYLFALLVIMPISLAMLHQASSPIDYRCPSCGLRFARRTTIARFTLLVTLLLVAVSVMLFAFYI